MIYYETFFKDLSKVCYYLCFVGGNMWGWQKDCLKSLEATLKTSHVKDYHRYKSKLLITKRLGFAYFTANYSLRFHREKENTKCFSPGIRSFLQSLKVNMKLICNFARYLPLNRSTSPFLL